VCCLGYDSVDNQLDKLIRIQSEIYKYMEEINVGTLSEIEKKSKII